MFTKLKHFERAWARESEGTLRVLRALTDASLVQAVAHGERTLGRIAWHITTTLPEMMGRTGLKLAGPGAHDPPPKSAVAIAAGYETAAKSLLDLIRSGWTDETLQQAASRSWRSSRTRPTTAGR